MTNPNNTHLIVLSVGDSDCGDGHGMNRKFYIKTNVDSDQLQEAYAAGVKIIGVDIDQLTQECQENKIRAKDRSKLFASGFDTSNLDPQFGISADEYLEIFMHTAQRGSSVLQGSPEEISWEFTQVDKLDIGGYGVVGP